MKLGFSVFIRVLVTGLMFVLLSPANAATRTFRGDLLPAPPGNQAYDFDDAGMWTAVPTASDLAFFTGISTNAYRIPDGSVFTLQLTGNMETEAIRWERGSFEVTLDLNGFTYTTTSINHGSSLVDSETGASTILNLFGGTANLAYLCVGYARGDGTLNLSGANTVLNITGSGNPDGHPTAVSFRVGSSGQRGAVNVTEGAKLTTACPIEIGRNSPAIGYVLVSGTDSRVESAGYVRAGNLGGDREGHITIEKGGHFQADSYLRVFPGSSLTVDGHAVASGQGGDPDVLDSALRVGTYLQADAGTRLAFVLSNPDVQTGAKPLVDVTGNVTFASSDVALDLSLSGDYVFSEGDTFTLIQYGGNLSGRFEGSPDSGDTIHVDGNWFEIDYGTSSNGAITVTAIPEPGVFALVLLGLGALSLRRR